MNLKSLALNAILKIDEKRGYSILHAICINKDVYSATRIAVQAIFAGHDIEEHRVSEKAERFAGMTTEKILGENWDNYVYSTVLQQLNLILHRDPTGFLKAVTEGDVDKVTRLVKEGVNVNQKICLSSGSHKLQQECSMVTLTGISGSQEVLTALIKLGGEVNSIRLETSLLSVACAWNNYSVAELLMRNGADVNAKDSSGNTALHYAAANGNVDIVQLLMDFKARPDDFHMTGNSALGLALAPDVFSVLALPPLALPSFGRHKLLSANTVLRTKKAQTSHFLINSADQ